jgi:putative aldouronate transport system permease protein
MERILKQNPGRIKRNFRRYWALYVMMAVPLIYFLLFKYGPMFGAVLAFRRYRVGQPFGAEWRGLYYFEMFLKDPDYWRAFRNTITLSLYNLVINFPGPVIFAILLNELQNKKFKKLVQTVSYAPRFMSTVVVISFMATMLMPNSGIVNKLMGTSIDFIGEPDNFKWLYVLTDTWQYTGFTAIIYLAAITGINTDLYEAARIDGANRWKQIKHVTIPGILPTVMVMLIMNVGRLLNLGFEKVLLLQRTRNIIASDIIDTYIYNRGIVGGSANYSLATAAGLFSAVIGMAFVLGSNALARKTTGSGIY